MVKFRADQNQVYTRKRRGATRAEDAQGTPTQSYISPSILGYEDTHKPEMQAMVKFRADQNQVLTEPLHPEADQN